jgi:hypothetical protein
MAINPSILFFLGIFFIGMGIDAAQEGAIQCKENV